ncbi:MAG: hypothetical protein EOP49_14480 [Sphingobacteriales bacterium]|nr:MAG: hypothetical protein EOP49_14480 [Sphingobacteriales bacterium]
MTLIPLDGFPGVGHIYARLIWYALLLVLASVIVVLIVKAFLPKNITSDMEQERHVEHQPEWDSETDRIREQQPDEDDRD